MKKTISMIAVSVAFSFAFLYMVVPIDLSAQILGGPSSSSACSPRSSSGSSSDKIDNPLKFDSIQCVISEGLKFVVNLLAIAGVIYIIWSGFLLVKAQGDPKALEAAKKSFMNAIIGMAIILGAWGIATMIANTINKVTNNNSQVLK